MFALSFRQAETPDWPGLRQGKRGSSSSHSGRRPRVGRRLATLGLLALLAFALLFSVPGLRGALHALRRINPMWILVAVALEFASELSFVVLFRLFL